MIVTLHDHLLTGGDWPAEIGRVERNGHTLARCTCGRVRSPQSIYHNLPESVTVAERIPGRVRRARMTQDRRAHADRAAQLRLRRREVVEVSPEWSCNVCHGPMRAELGMSRREFDRRLGA